MIRLENMSKHYGGGEVFSGLSLQVTSGQRIGLVGDNGAGKSTLLKIIAGEIKPDDGDRIVAKNATIGMLRQEIGGDGEIPLLENVLKGAIRINALQKEMDRIGARLDEAQHSGDTASAEKLAHSMAEAQESFSEAGGYAIEGNARAILAGLGFLPAQFGDPTGSFSGGWQTRVGLARLLLSRPDLLLLDEPTNHLDLESSIWLESFLSAYEGAVIIISHDRFFLNRLVDSTAEIEMGKLTFYPYPYNKYVVEKQKRRELLESSAVRQKKEIERQERFIERFRAKNTKATAVQSRIKALAKIERIEVAGDTASIGFRFQETGRIGHTPVEVTQATVAYGDNVVYENLDFIMRRGDRIALAGPNGAGKSTLIKLISGALALRAGNVRIAESVSMRYFAQHQLDSLDPEKTVLEELTSHIPFDAIPRARSILGAFLFRNDDVDKKVKVLSGGEKSRVALAKIALNPTNLLLLDEPTNHLDLKSRMALEKALAGYGGCVLFISHDRAFIDAVANKIVHIENGKLTEFLGDWAFYEAYREQRLASGAEPVPAKETASATLPSRKTKKESRRDAARQRKSLNEIAGPLKKELISVESRIGKVEKEIESAEKELARPDIYNDAVKVRDLSKELGALKKENAQLLSRWEELAKKLEAISSGPE